MRNLLNYSLILAPPEDNSVSGILDMSKGLLSSWSYFFTGVFAIGVLLIVAGLILSFTDLGKSFGNPQKAAKAKEAIFYSFVALIVAGGLMFFVTLAYNLLA